MPGSSDTDGGEAGDPSPTVETFSLRAAGMPTQAAAWGVVGFFAVLIVFMGTRDALAGGDSGRWLVIGLVSSILVGIAVSLWPRPRYLRELHVTPTEVRGVDRQGQSLAMPVSDVELVSVEGRFKLGIDSYEAWGMLHIRGGRTWLAMEMNPVGARDSFEALLRRLPRALGLSGDQRIEVPALENPAEATAWVERIRLTCQRELGRQVRYSLFYGSVSGCFGLGALINVLCHGLGNGASLGDLGLVPALVISSVAFFVAARRRRGFLRRILADVERIDVDLRGGDVTG